VCDTYFLTPGLPAAILPAMTPVAILVRVSTNKQETDRQVHELQAHAAAEGWTVHEVVHETVSGSSTARPGLDRILGLAAAGTIAKVLVHEVSRIARKNSVAHAFLEDLTTHGVSLYWHSQRIETLLPDGRRNPAASIMFALLAEVARGEKELLIERTRSGLQAARRRGVRLGRTPGTTEDPAVFLAKYPEVARLLRKDRSVREVERLTYDPVKKKGVARNTILKVRRLLNPAAV